MRYIFQTGPALYAHATDKAKGRFCPSAIPATRTRFRSYAGRVSRALYARSQAEAEWIAGRTTVYG